MWKISKNEKFEIWTSNICVLNICYDKEDSCVYVNYKGYNIVMLMGMWGFEDEIQDRNIEYDIGGEKGRFNSIYYKVKKNNLKLFCDLIYFFISEHSLDSMLNDKFKFEI